MEFCQLAPCGNTVNLFSSPRTLAGEGAHMNIVFIQVFSLSLALSHKWGERSEGGAEPDWTA